MGTSNHGHLDAMVSARALSSRGSTLGLFVNTGTVVCTSDAIRADAIQIRAISSGGETPEQLRLGGGLGRGGTATTGSSTSSRPITSMAHKCTAADVLSPFAHFNGVWWASEGAYPAWSHVSALCFCLRSVDSLPCDRKRFSAGSADT